MDRGERLSDATIANYRQQLDTRATVLEAFAALDALSTQMVRTGAPSELIVVDDAGARSDSAGQCPVVIREPSTEEACSKRSRATPELSMSAISVRHCPNSSPDRWRNVRDALAARASPQARRVVSRRTGNRTAARRSG